MADDHLIPNSTQIPNVLLDLLMPFLHDSEARVLWYLCRRTYGFQREIDQISLDQFVHGIKGESRQLDYGAGVSRRAAISALEFLKATELVQQIEGGPGRSRIPVYRLNLKCEMVQRLHLMSQEPDYSREKIGAMIARFREKGETLAPITGNPKKDKPLEEKVQPLHPLEKVQRTTEKGATNDTHNKTKYTKPRTTKPPVSPNGETSPSRGMRLPKDWHPTEALMAWAHDKGIDQILDLAEETEAFCRYWWSRSRDAAKLDWGMTWQNRMRDRADFVRDKRARGSPSPPPTVSDGHMAELIAKKEAEDLAEETRRARQRHAQAP